MVLFTEPTSLLAEPITATIPDGITFTADPSALTIFPAAVARPSTGLPGLAVGGLAAAGRVEVGQADPVISECARGASRSGAVVLARSGADAENWRC